MNFISFKANYLGTATVKKYNNITKNYANSDVSVIELDPSIPKDFDVIDDINSYWRGNKGEFCFASKIYIDALSSRDNMINLEKQESFIAFTTQDSNLKNLNRENIIGIAEVVTDYTKHKHDIVYLQTNPKHSFKSKHREFTDIGKQLVETIKKLFKCDIELVSLETLTEFYKKLGFVQIFPQSKTQLIFRHK